MLIVSFKIFITLNSLKSIVLSSLVSILVKIFSMLASERSSVMDFRKSTTSPRVKVLLPSVSMEQNISLSSWWKQSFGSIFDHMKSIHYLFRQFSHYLCPYYKKVVKQCWTIWWLDSKSVFSKTSICQQQRLYKLKRPVLWWHYNNIPGKLQLMWLSTIYKLDDFDKF